MTRVGQKEEHWMTSIKIETEREYIKNMEWCRSEVVGMNFGNWRIYLLPFVMAKMGKHQLYKDNEVEKKFHTYFAALYHFLFIYSMYFYLLQFDVSDHYFSHLIRVTTKRVLVYVAAYLTVLGNLLLVYRSLFIDRRFAWGHFFWNTLVLTLNCLALGHGELIFVSRAGLKTLDRVCLLHLIIFIMFNGCFCALSWWIMFFRKEKKLRILRYLRKLNEKENNIRVVKIVEEVIEDLVDNVELAQDLENGIGVTITVNGISETSV